MYKFQQQKSAYPQLSNDLADFSPGMYAVKPSTSSNSSHNLKLSTKPSTPRVNNYDGSNSSLVNSGKLKALLTTADNLISEKRN
jgi:hypothetical protein